MTYIPVSQRNSQGANIPAQPVSVNGYTPVSSRQNVVPTVPKVVSGVESVNGYVPVAKRPEGFAITPPVVQPEVVPQKIEKQGLLKRYNNWAQNFGKKNATKPLTEVVAPIGIGAMRVIGSTTGAIETLNEKRNQLIPQNPISKYIDKIIAPDIDKKEKASTKIQNFAQKADLAINEITGKQDKTYLRKVSEGLGSSIPFLAGGIAIKALNIPATIASAGFGTVEAMINGYEDYKTLIDEGDDEETAGKKALASFGANLALNTATNKLGGFFDTLAPGIIPSLKRFLTVTLTETGQETAQTLISNLTTGKKATDGLTETALVSLPISGLFGLGGISMPKNPTKSSKAFEELVQTARKEGTTDDDLSTAISEITKAPIEEVKKSISLVPQDTPAEVSTLSTQERTDMLTGKKPVVAPEPIPLENRKITYDAQKEEDAKKSKSFDDFVGAMRADDEFLVGKTFKELQDFYKQSNNIPDVEVEKPNEETIKKLEEELKVVYKNDPEIEKGLAEMFVELDLAEAGKRVFLEYDATRDGSNVVAVPSTFPKWIPEKLRTRKSVETLKTVLTDINKISYPKKSNAVGQRLLINEMLNVLDGRLGIDTSGIRSDILKQYGQDQTVDNKDTGGSEPRGGRGEPTKQRAEIEKKKDTERNAEIATLKEEIESKQGFDGPLSDAEIKQRQKRLKELKPKTEKKTEKMPKTPSGNAMAIYKDESTPEIPITPGKLINDINPIEFPELVDLARELMGKVPQIVGKSGNAAGRFYADKSNPRIKLIAELFDGKNPRQMAVVLAHEIGHLVDFLPEGTLARGNMLGRLKSLNKFMKNSFGSEESVTNKDIRAELMKVTQELHPYNPEKIPASYKRYRESAKELYAEAISMLFNNPGRLQELAPKFWKEFFAELDKKPEVSKAFFELQDLLGGDRDLVLQKRREGVRGMFQKGDIMAGDIQKHRMAIAEERNKNFSFQFKFNLIDKNYAIIDRINKMQKEGKILSDDENPLYYLEERNYIGGKMKAFMEKNIQPIYKKLTENEISWTDFGEALFYDRIRAGDRSDVANPRGITPQASEELIQKMFTELGPEKSKLLVDSMDSFRKALKSITTEAYEEGLYKDEMYQKMQENPAYATFQVLDHMEEALTSKVHKSLGTLKDVANVADSSLLKTISTIRAIERNKVTKKVVEFLEKNFKEDIKPADTVKTPKGAIPKESKLPNQELITYMDKGTLKGFYVDKYIKSSINNETIGQTIAVLRVMNSALFRPLFITYNPGFQAFNFLRDFQRFWKNTPNMTIMRAMKLYKQAIPVARARAWGDTTNEMLQKLENDQILSITYNQLTDGSDIETAQIDTIMRESGIDSFQPEVRYKALQPFVKVLDFIKNTGDFIETLPKVAGYLEFSKGGTQEITREQKSFIRKNIGSPDFYSGGYWKPVTNEVFLFSNAITQGIRSDIMTATDPKTRSGYWYKTAKVNFLPKILMMLAGLGLFGDEVKEILNGASEYDKTSYTILPIGIDENGKPIYFRMPQDEGGRLLGGIFWKFINSFNNDQSLGKDFVDIASLTGGQIPSITPTISNTVAIGQFAVGQNPYDWFRNREVLTDDQMKAGGKYALKPFGGWLFNQMGGGIFYKFNQGAPRDKGDAEKFIGLPVVSNTIGRFFRVSDYGKTEDLNKIKENVQSEQARRRIDENNIINDYISSAQKNLDDKSIEDLVKENKADLVQEVLGKAPETKEELTRANNIIKKYQIGLKRGESDPVINSLISAVTNEEKVEILTELRKTLTDKEYNIIMLESLKFKIVSPEVFLKVPKPAQEK